MLSVEEIKSIINAGEGYNAEFKAKLPQKYKKIAEEVCAFCKCGRRCYPFWC